MPRGFIRRVYRDDLGRPWLLWVDRDYADQSERGWGEDPGEDQVPLPRSWKPRRVIGIDASGRLQRAVVGTVSADLWTGAAPTFVVEATDQSSVVATVISWQGERAS